MKTLKTKRTRKIAIMACLLLAIIAGISIATDARKGIGATIAMATLVGGVTLEGKEEALYVALKTSIDSEIEKHTKGYISETKMTENINAALAKFAPNIKDNEHFIKLQTEIEGLNEKLKAQGLELKAMKEVGKVEITPSIAAQLKAHREAHKDLWEKMKKPGAPSFEIELKVAGTMLESGNVGAGTYFPAIGIEPGVVDIARAKPSLIKYVNYAQTSNRLIIWVEKTNPDGNAGWIAEGAVKPLIDFEYKTVTSAIKKVADKIKVSTEMLDDVDNIAGDINNELKYKVDMLVVAAILAGTGLNDEPEGITHWASLFVTTTLATTSPNNKDAILAAAAQIRSLFFEPDYAFINTIDGANMEMEKTDQGLYILPPFTSANGQTIAGLTIVQTSSIPVGHVLVGDMKKMKVREKGNFVVTVGWVADDFEKNLVTMIGERRMHMFIADNDSGAFIYDTLANIKSAITQI